MTHQDNQNRTPVEWTLRWPFGEVTVQALGGMLAPLNFLLPDGRTISPFQVAPWGAENNPALPGVLRRLRGEWPCLPYGASRAPEGLPQGWTAHDAEDSWDHGYTANHDWYLIGQTDETLTVGIVYPEGGPIERLERVVRPSKNSASVEVELTVHARQRVQLPLALHPTFAIPESGVEIMSAPAERIDTYPISPEPGVSRLQPNVSAVSLDAMPTVAGTLDFHRLPLPYNTEELMQMVGCKPPFKLRYLEDQIDIHLDWNTAVLPDALIWISNAGRCHAPWSGRHFALGIEPMSGFFDLGRVVVPGNEHPLAGHKGVFLDPEKPLVVSYSVAASGSPAPP